MSKPVWERKEICAMNSLELVEYIVHLKAQLDAVREAVENIPHDSLCATTIGDACDCFKQALEKDDV